MLTDYLKIFHFKYSKSLLIIFCYLLGCHALTVMAQKPRSLVRSLLDERDHIQIEKNLLKVAQKDSLNPWIAYGYAMLYTDSAYSGFEPSKAYQMVDAVLKRIENKEINYLAIIRENELTVDTFLVIKKDLEQVFFQQAKAQNSIGGYQQFLNAYPTASQIIEAQSNIDQLAFEIAEEKNTWQGYQYFMSRYSLSEQFSLAFDRFHKLVYKEKAQSGRTEDLLLFINDYPDTPFREEIEKVIFRNETENFVTQQIDDYVFKLCQNKNYGTKALQLLYHLDAPRLLNRKDELKSMGFGHFLDSMNALTQIPKESIIPIAENSKYFLMNSKGKLAWQDSLPFIPEIYKCGNYNSRLLIIPNEKSLSLVNRLGSEIYNGNIESFEVLGQGMIAIVKQNAVGLYHLSGFEILPFEHQEIKAFHELNLIFKKDDQYGIIDVRGNIKCPNVYDRISKNGHFVVFEKNGFQGISSISHLLTDSIELYEEVEILDANHCIAYAENEEILFDQNMNIISPEQTSRIYNNHENWVFRTDIGYYHLGPNTSEVSPILFDDFQQNKSWLGLKKNDKWKIFHQNINNEPILDIDSVKMMGESMVILFRNNDGMILLPNKKMIEIDKADLFHQLNANSGEQSVLMVIKRKHKTTIYKDGEEIFTTSFDELNYLGNELLSFKEGKKYGLMNIEGKVLLKPSYAAISEAKNGVVSLLKYKGFGLFDIQSQNIVATIYDNVLRKYNDSLFIGRRDGMDRLIDIRKGEESGSEHEEIRYFTNDLYMAKDDDKWGVYDLTGKVLLDDMMSFEFISDKDNHKRMSVLSQQGFGIFDSRYAVVVDAVYHDVRNVATPDNPVYKAVHYFDEADFYTIVYYDQRGNKIKTLGYSGLEYRSIDCVED